jgi:hypothetical protein
MSKRKNSRNSLTEYKSRNAWRRSRRSGAGALLDGLSPFTSPGYWKIGGRAGGQRPEMKIHEQIPFRLFRMPCCSHLLCWVNPRSPNYCPECGKPVFALLRKNGSGFVLFSDDKAFLSYDDKKEPL